MAMRPRGLVWAMVIVMLAASTSGCWDREELDEVGIVGAIGLDKGGDGQVIVSLEVVNPKALASAQTMGGDSAPVVAVVLRDQADTISSAIRNAQRRLPRTLTMGQVSSIIVGQSLAREGIGQYLDFVLRDARIRNSAVLATCDTGSGLLQRPLIEPIPSRVLLALSNTALAGGKTVRTTINEFTVKLAEPGIEPVTLHTAGRKTKDIQVKRQGEEVKQTDKAVMLEQPIEANVDIEGELPPDSPVLNPLKEAASGESVPGMTIDVGVAAYKGDKLVGLLDGAEARGYLWLSGDLREASVEVPDPFGSGKMVGLDVVRANSSIKPIFEGGPEGIKMHAEIHVDLEAAQFQLATDLRKTGIIDALEQSLDALVTREIRATLERVQKEFKSDIYGFGYEVYKSNPDLWATMEHTWNDEVFPNVEVELDVVTRVRAPGAIYGLLPHGLLPRK
ncbi:MAG: Ger(x)C family spore germination protein [Bacillota bacterium]